MEPIVSLDFHGVEILSDSVLGLASPVEPKYFQDFQGLVTVEVLQGEVDAEEIFAFIVHEENFFRVAFGNYTLIPETNCGQMALFLFTYAAVARRNRKRQS